MNILECGECYCFVRDSAWNAHVAWHKTVVYLTMLGQGFTVVAAKNGAERSCRDLKFELIGSFNA